MQEIIQPKASNGTPLKVEDIREALIWCYLQLGRAQRSAHNMQMVAKIVDRVMDKLNELLICLYLNNKDLISEALKATDQEANQETREAEKS